MDSALLQLPSTSTLGSDCASWRLNLSAAWLRTLLAENRSSAAQTSAARIRTRDSDEDRKWKSGLLGAMEALESGPGFVVIQGLSLTEFDEEQARLLYLLLGCQLGTPLAQDKEGTILLDVVDTSSRLSWGSSSPLGGRWTNLPYHTDNAWGAIFPDYVGLLCLNQAARGGVLKLIDAWAVVHELRSKNADLLSALQEDYPFDKRRQLQKGEDSLSRAPILTLEAGRLTFRYLHCQIDHSALGPRQRDAIAVLEHVLHRPEFQFEVTLRTGDVCFANNHRILHSRTAYENDGISGKPRHHVRLWLSRFSHFDPKKEDRHGQ